MALAGFEAVTAPLAVGTAEGAVARATVTTGLAVTVAPGARATANTGAVAFTAVAFTAVAVGVAAG